MAVSVRPRSKAGPVAVDYLGGDVKCSACGHTTSEGHAVILATGEGTPAFCPSCPVCQAEQKREPKDT
jgi:hypothetical protein